MTNDLRDQVADQLEEFSRPGGLLSSSSPRSSFRMHGDSPARLRIWDTIAEESLAEQVDVPRNGKVAVITAGPPGAGKSTKVRAFLGEGSDHWRTIDPDEVKVRLIQQVVRDQDYEQILRQGLADGRPIMPMELAGLVHEESVQIANEIRRRAMTRGENVVIEGTLAWPDMVGVHLGEVAIHGYDDLQIVMVDIPSTVARERALTRWWEERDDPETDLGGRFVPMSVIDGCYAKDDGASASVCRKNADELHRRARRMEGLGVRMLETSEAQLEEPHTGTSVVRFKVVNADD